MSNQNKKVIVDIETRGGDALKASFDNARASAEAMDAELVSNLQQTQKEAQGLIDKEIAYAREKGNSLKAMELIKDALNNELNSEGRTLDLLIKKVQVQKEIAALALSATQAPQAQIQETDLAKRAAEQQQYLALQKQIEESDLAAASARGAQMAREQQQIEETDMLRRKSAEDEYNRDGRIIDLQIQLARARKLDTDALFAQAIAEAELAGDTERVLQLQIRQEQVQNQLSNSTNQAMRDSRGARDALFALGLALNLIITELGTNLPPAAKEAASGIKIVADAMLAGAYIGGAAGAALGAVAGVLLTVGSVALTQDPVIKALNDSLDKLGKKDDAVSGLMQLTGVTEQNATDALAYLKANNQLADSFNAQVKAAQPAIPVLQGIGDALRAVHDIQTALVNAIRNAIPIYDAYIKLITDLPQILHNTAIYAETFTNAISKGTTIAQADALAMYAVANAAKAQKDATDALTTSALQLASAQQAATLGKSADTLGENFLSAQEDNRAAMEAASEKFYGETLPGIIQDGLDKVAQINQNYADKIKEINDNLRQSEADAYANYQQNVIDAELNASDRRITLASELGIAIADAEEQAAQKRQSIVDNYNETIEKQAQSRAEKLLQIQIAYQNAIEQIQDTYNQSVFNAITNQDAKALVLASMARERALKKENEAHQQQLDAVERQRALDAANAKEAEEKAQKAQSDALARQEEKLRDNYEKQMRALDEALRKQENKLREEYEKRIKALEDAAAKQKEVAGDTRDKELIAQGIAQQKALTSAQRAYNDQATVREAAYAKKLESLAKSLADEKDMTDQNGRAIIDSLKTILGPDAMQTILKDFESAMNARIDIQVTPLSTKRNIDTFAEGGYTGASIGMVHPNELVLPLGNENRTSQLMQQYVPQRVMQQMPAWASQSASSSNNSGELHVHVHMDNSMLSATIEQNTTEMLMQVIPQVHQSLTRGGV